MYDIASIDELINELGGPEAVAAFLGISRHAVGMWKVRGEIGNGWHLRLLAEVRRRGLTIDPAVFGLNADEARGLFPLAGPECRPAA